MNRCLVVAWALVLPLAAPALAEAAAAPAAPALNLQLPMQSYASVLAAPAQTSSVANTGAGALVPAAGAKQPAGTLNDSKPLVWGSFSTGVGYGEGLGSSNWQSANVNATKLFGSAEHPWAVTGSVAGGLGYSQAFGATQWEGGSVEMSKMFGNPAHPFALTIGISAAHMRTLGNGNWPNNP
ncbi:hypothetical protein [Metallibacterium sp.]|jgi:hypothetical protein|uniref:hypothetical protein n=1 Tax=Metallibacterium sp. TaxID=2940281 RepID=UPI00262CE5B2|nr:hypothetical protein [Metallibacterium sp.]